MSQPDGKKMYLTWQDQGNLKNFRVDEAGHEWLKMHKKQLSAILFLSA